MPESIRMTVVTASPDLTAVADGADTACPVTTLDAATYAVGDRVSADLRTPHMPLVTGKVDST